MSAPASPSPCPDWPRESLDKLREETQSFWATLRATRARKGIAAVAEWTQGQRTLMNPLVFLGTQIALCDLVVLVLQWILPTTRALPAWVEVVRLVLLPYLLLPFIGVVAHAVLGRGERAVPMRATIGAIIYISSPVILVFVYLLFAAAEFSNETPYAFFLVGTLTLGGTIGSSFRAIHGASQVRAFAAALLSTAVILAVMVGLELMLFHMRFSSLSLL